MRYFLLLLACLTDYTICSAISFKMVQCTVLPNDAASGSGRLGGISAMRYLGKGQLALYSDHDRDGYTYEVITDTLGNVLKTNRWNALQSVECVRMAANGVCYYSFEQNKSTGVGFIAKSKTEVLFSEPIPGPNTSDNRGIEGMALDAGGGLWAAFESGGSTACAVENLTFYFYPFRKGKPDASKRIAWQYPFDRCSCSSRFNGKFGNGVSELLDVPGEPGKLLVLERCFSGIQASIKLFLVSRPDTGTLLNKKLIFNFNDPILINGKRFYPDNLEAMAWGPMENGRKTLYLISDDNFNTLQRTQIIKLVEE